MVGLPNTYAAIDIGSNAIRLLVAQYFRGRLVILEDRRAALRLGQDAFSKRMIGTPTVRQLIEGLRCFRAIAESHGVFGIRTVATSALRDSKNRDLIIQQVWQNVGLHIEIINGIQEAELLYKAVSRSLDLTQKKALLIDMGGGSLEVVHSARGRVRSAESLRLGTVRLLHRVGRDQSYSRYAMVIRRELANWIASLPSVTDLIHDDVFIGTGGNLRCIGRLASQISGRQSRSLVTTDDIEELTQVLFRFHSEKRARYFDLKSDRVDVILPACVIVSEMMQVLNFDRLYVPNVGIKNGLIWEMVDRNRNLRSLHSRIQKEIR